MELKRLKVIKIIYEENSLNRTFYGIETCTAAAHRTGREVLIVPFMELKQRTYAVSVRITKGLNRTFYGIETRGNLRRWRLHLLS